MIEDTWNDVEVLLVEDSGEDAELAIRALKKHNLANKLLHLKDGEQAIDFLFAQNTYEKKNSSCKPKLIMLDLKFPKVNGLEVLEAVRKDQRTKSIPVVVLTSSAEEQDVIESYRLGVNSYIVKPIEFNKFVEAVRHIGLYWLLMNTPK
jgi:two-component system response regulator